jgi:UDP-glucose 4-epimerase
LHEFYIYDNQSKKELSVNYSVKEIKDTAEEITGIDFEVEEAERREGDPARLIADSSKAKKILNWKPQYDLENIIQTAWNWHKQESENDKN